MIEIIALILLAGFATYFLIPWALKILARKRFLRTVASCDAVCLTFDDGPHRESTSAILELLERARAKATFFMLGENIEAYPEIAAKIVDQGHEVGEHSYEHTHPWTSGPIRSLRDLVRGGRTIAPYRCPGGPVLFRPPFGKLNCVTLLYTLVLRRRLVFWNVNPRDYEQDSPEEVAGYVRMRIAPGSVILLHDGRRDSSNSGDVTVLALDTILKEITRRGLATVTVGEALGTSGLRESASRAARPAVTLQPPRRMGRRSPEDSAGFAIDDAGPLRRKNTVGKKRSVLHAKDCV